MKLSVCLFMLISFFAGGVQSQAQTTGLFQREGNFYIVKAEANQKSADDTSALLEKLYAMYSDWLPYTAKLPAKFQVRLLKDEGSFRQYMGLTYNQPNRNTFAYIHSSQPNKRELVLFGEVGDLLKQGVSGQAAIQYISGYVPRVPVWLREGMGAYFNFVNLENGKYVRDNDQKWMQPLKTILSTSQGYLTAEQLINLTDKDLATITANALIPQAWGYVYFMADGKNATWTEVFNSIKQLMINSANSPTIASDIANLVAAKGYTTLESDYRAFMGSSRSFSDVANEAIKAFNAKELDRANPLLDQASAINPQSYIPWYYKGLIAYEKNDYKSADTFYKEAQKRGAPDSFISYALGLNAFAANDQANAKLYLQKASEDAAYKDRVTPLLQRLP